MVELGAPVRFRRALMHAMDRQEMVDTIQAGLAEVAHTYLGPDQREYGEVEGSIVRYDYDPRRAAQIIARYFDGEEVPPQILIPTGLYRRADGLKDPTLK